MSKLGTDIKTAQNIYAILYGDNEVFKEVNVNLWLSEANEIKTYLRCNTLTETLQKLISIVYDTSTKNSNRDGN